MRPDTILVTGASGLIGHALASRLQAEGRNVIGLDRRPPRAGRASFPFVEAELNDVHRLYAAVRGREPAGIVHCGGVSGLMVARDNPFLICQTNILGTAHVLELARLVKACRVIFCSSISAYGHQEVDGVVTEDTPMRGRTTYGASKIAGEAILQAYAEEHGVGGIALRFTHVYGPGRETQCFVRAMIEDALARRASHLPHARRARRQYVYVTDVVDAIVLALDAEAPPRRAYNVGSGRQHRLGEVADAVRSVIGPLDVAFDDACDPLEYTCGTLDISAAGRELAWRPKIDLNAGIAAYAEFLRAFYGSTQPPSTTIVWPVM
ncbi:MAG: NAD-dependent epimerase/dehydratase family protein [Candidatus Rokuibacteriota bacterium]